MVENIPYHRPLLKFRGSHMISNGPYVEILEDDVQSLYDVEHVIAVSSCTAGLMLCLWFQKPDIMALPSFNWWTPKELLEMMGIFHSYIDIDSKTWLMKKNEITYQLPVHTFGNILSLNDDNVIYDGAHALGAEITDFGLATVLSLAPTKLITACEGGVILTNNKELAQFCMEKRKGLCRMSEPNAYMGVKTFRHLDQILEWKKLIFDYYSSNLPGIFQDIPLNSNYNTIGMLTNLKIPPHIECRKYYEPLSLEDHLKVTKYIYNKIVCLPSWYGVDYEKIVTDILDYNESINNGRLRVFGDSDRQVPEQP